ncbi:MAG: hypothetical protein Q8K98_07605 [Bacteroidota bacterium]|nr:hypothetical protein [Bacteroidota bacterium]
MKKIICVSLLVLSFSLFAQNENMQDIKDFSKNIFKVNVMEYGDKKYSVMAVDTVDSSHFLHNFVQQNRVALDYLLQNQLEIKSDSFKILVDNKEELIKYFYNSIDKDTAFTNSFTDLICYYLSAQGNPVAGYNYKTKYDVSINKIASITARFFYPNKLIEGKSISMKLCVAALSFKDYEGERNFLEEAFAFSVVVGSAQSDNQALIEEYKKEANFVINMKLSSQEDVKLNRIQGAIWALLSKNPIVIEEIKTKYNEQKDSLPFSLIF